MNQGGQLKIKGFLQQKLIAEINYSDLQKLQPQGQGIQPNHSQLFQNKNNFLTNVKISYNRPKISNINLNSGILNYEITTLPDLDISVELMLIQKYEKKKQQNEDQIKIIKDLTQLNDQQSILIDKNNNNNYNNFNNGSNSNNNKNNQNNGINMNQNNSENNLYNLQQMNVLFNNKDNNDVNPQINLPLVNNPQSFYGSLNAQLQNIEPSSYFNQTYKDILQFSKETNVNYEISKEYVEKYGNFDKALAKYYEDLQLKYA